jgi:hypothetical protein
MKTSKPSLSSLSAIRPAASLSTSPLLSLMKIFVIQPPANATPDPQGAPVTKADAGTASSICAGDARQRG